MLIADVIKVSAANAMRGRTRAVLTALSIAIGISSVMLVSSLGDSGAHIINKELDKLGINGISIFSSGNSKSIPLKLADAKFIEKNIDSVTSALPVVLEYGGYRINRSVGNMVIWGVDSGIERILDINLLYGRMPNSIDIKAERKVAVIDDALAKKSYHRENVIGKNILINISGKTSRFEIIGIIKSQNDGLNQLAGGAIPDFVYLPYSVVNRLRASNDISQIAVKCSNTVSLEETGNKITKLLSRINNNPDGYLSENMAGYVDNLKSIAGLVALLISAIAAISLCVAGLGIMNTMLSSTVERQKEIGICMAVGAKQRDISMCFLTESVIISVIGGTAGAFVGIGISFLVTKLLGMESLLSPEKLLIAEMMSIFCGAVFSVIPARRASRLDPIIALRNE